MNNDKIIKDALHGFWDDSKQLVSMIKENRSKYYIKRMVQLKEANKQRKNAFTFERQLRSINTDPSKKRAFVSLKNFDLIKDFIDLNPILL